GADADLAQVGIPKARQHGAAANVKLAAAKRRDHDGGAGESNEIDLKAKLGEIALLDRDVEAGVRRLVDGADVHGAYQIERRELCLRVSTTDHERGDGERRQRRKITQGCHTSAHVLVGEPVTTSPGHALELLPRRRVESEDAGGVEPEDVALGLRSEERQGPDGARQGGVEGGPGRSED